MQFLQICIHELPWYTIKMCSTKTWFDVQIIWQYIYYELQRKKCFSMNTVIMIFLHSDHSVGFIAFGKVIHDWMTSIIVGVVPCYMYALIIAKFNDLMQTTQLITIQLKFSYFDYPTNLFFSFLLIEFLFLFIDWRWRQYTGGWYSSRLVWSNVTMAISNGPRQYSSKYHLLVL